MTQIDEKGEEELAGRDFAGQLFALAHERQQDALCRFHGNPNGSYGGTVGAQGEDGRLLVRISSSSFGEFSVKVERPGSYERYEPGPEYWHYTRYEKAASRYEERASGAASDEQLQALIELIKSLSFSAKL